MEGMCALFEAWLKEPALLLGNTATPELINIQLSTHYAFSCKHGISRSHMGMIFHVTLLLSPTSRAGRMEHGPIGCRMGGQAAAILPPVQP